MTSRVDKLERAAANLDDADLYDIHSRVSRLATARRIQNDPKYRQNLVAGRAAAAGKATPRNV